MKNKISIGLTLSYLILLFVVAGIVFKSVAGSIEANIKEIFWNAISKEGNERLVKLNIFVLRGTGLPDKYSKEVKDGVFIENAKGEAFVPYSESNQRLEKFYRVINSDQSYLAIKSPIQIEQLDSFFQKGLEENKIRTKTFLYFRDNKNNREGWSCPYEPSLFSGKDICLDSIQIGVQKELFLKAYIHYPYVFVAGKIVKRMFPYVTFPLAAIVLIIGLYYNIRFFWLKKRKKEGFIDFLGPNGNFLDRIIFNIEGEKSKFLSEYVDPPQIERADICWDDRTLIFYFYEYTIPLSRQNYHLLKLFLSKPDGILTKDEISKSLWGNLHEAQTRLVKCMQRFRANFEGIPGIEIQTGKKNYYKFTINRRLTDKQSGTKPPIAPNSLSDSSSSLDTGRSGGSKSDAKSTSDTKTDLEPTPNLDADFKSGIEPASDSESNPDSVSKPDSKGFSSDSSPEDLNGACQ